MSTFQIGVAGGAECPPNEYQIARQTGAAIARSGAVLLCGGRLGVMEAAARGALECGGVTIGVVPGAERGSANEFIQYEICTGLGQARNVVFVLSCDALIAVGGEYGTLSEIAVALKHRIPVVGLGTWSIPAIADDPLFAVAKSPGEAVNTAVALAGSARTAAGRVISKSDR